MENLTQRFQDAVQQFWTGRNDALQKQIDAGKVDAGSRGAVTAGMHLGPVEALIVDLLEDAGLNRLDVNTQVGLELPGFFRPEKRWDLLVVSQGQLITAIEFKSQVGSVGNNFNNRSEECIGNATDIWTAYREGLLGQSRPFVGYFFLLEDSDTNRRPVRVKNTTFPTDKVFTSTSYSERYEILCRRLVLERLYDATCLTLATKSDQTEISHPSPEVGIESFADQLQWHVKGVLRRMAK